MIKWKLWVRNRQKSGEREKIKRLHNPTEQNNNNIDLENSDEAKFKVVIVSLTGVYWTRRFGAHAPMQLTAWCCTMHSTQGHSRVQLQHWPQCNGSRDHLNRENLSLFSHRGHCGQYVVSSITGSCKDSIINLEESGHIQRFSSSRVIVEHCPWHMRAIFLILRFLSKWTCTLRTIWNRKAQPLMSLVLELSKQLSSILGEREN